MKFKLPLRLTSTLKLVTLQIEIFVLQLVKLQSDETFDKLKLSVLIYANKEILKKECFD